MPGLYQLKQIFYFLLKNCISAFVFLIGWEGEGWQREWSTSNKNPLDSKHALWGNWTSEWLREMEFRLRMNSKKKTNNPIGGANAIIRYSWVENNDDCVSIMFTFFFFPFFSLLLNELIIFRYAYMEHLFTSEMNWAIVRHLSFLQGVVTHTFYLKMQRQRGIISSNQDFLWIKVNECWRGSEMDFPTDIFHFGMQRSPCQGFK